MKAMAYWPMATNNQTWITMDLHLWLVQINIATGFIALKPFENKPYQAFFYFLSVYEMHLSTNTYTYRGTHTHIRDDDGPPIFIHSIDMRFEL